MTFVYVLAFLITSLLLILCMACEVYDAFHPKAELFEAIRPYAFFITLAMFPIVVHFFSFFIDFSVAWEFIKGIPKVMGEALKLIKDFVSILIYLL